ncbi:MAG: VWA domain-containing protein [Succinivibrio sp.]|nr:VWA domain-containing protein [Succinivibrio sp.]
MIRILRLQKKDLTADALSYAQHSRLWREELTGSVEDKAVLSLSYAEIDGEYVNYYTDLEGSVEEPREDQLPSDLRLRADSIKKSFNDFLDSKGKLNNNALEAHKSEFVRLLDDSRIFIIGSTNPVIVPAQTRAMAVHRAQTIKAAKAAEKNGGCLVPFFIMLLILLLILGSLWWFFLKPWPQEGSFKERINDLLNSWGFNSLFRLDTSAQQETLAVIQQRVDEMLAQKEQEEQLLAEEERLKKEKMEEERLKELEAARLAEEEARKKAEEARLLEEEARKKAEEEAEKLRAEAEAAKIKAEEERKKAEEAAANARQNKPSAQQNTITPQQNDSTQSAGGNKTLPKCTTLKKEGKLPQMVVAFDGSESMLIEDVRTSSGRGSRLDVATGAANNMIRSIDRNVDIGFVEINGCSAAKNHGFFGGGNRSALVSRINSINPRRYDGMTPLVDGLNKMADMVDGVNADAVGVLISDGEDTCPFTHAIDVCQLAARIHARKPRLKIHTILIGDGAGKAACVAKITGGKVFSPNNASEINAQLKAAGSEMKQVCKE